MTINHGDKMETKEGLIEEMIKEYHYTKGQVAMACTIVFIAFCGLIIGGTALILIIINNFIK